jgi:hypothetical protein
MKRAKTVIIEKVFLKGEEERKEGERKTAM